MDSCSVHVKVLNASTPPGAKVPSASLRSKLVRVECSLSVAVWTSRTKSFSSASQLRPTTRLFNAAPRTGATAIPPGNIWCLFYHQVLYVYKEIGLSCSSSPYYTFFPPFQTIRISFLHLPTAPEGEPVRYRVETLALFVLGPVVVLALLSVVSVLACRRLHHGRLQRLQEFDAEQGAIDGLITSNVGDSTLAVRVTEITMKRDLAKARRPISRFVFSSSLWVLGYFSPSIYSYSQKCTYTYGY